MHSHTHLQVEALKLQINFRQKVLDQSHQDKSVFKFSQNKKQHSIVKLKENLFKLLIDGESADGDGVPVNVPSEYDKFVTQPELLVGQQIQHQFKVNGELLWYEGRVMKHNTTTNEIEVQYDGEDNTCWFPLLEDMSAGELFVISK